MSNPSQHPNLKTRDVDEPKWSFEKITMDERKTDDLKQGDAIQEWKAHVGKDYRVEWYWHNGDVLSVVDKPCGGDGAPAWVALIQWHDGNYVKGWSALTQTDWIHKSVMLRRKPTVTKS